MSYFTNILCGILLPIFLVICGVFFTFKLRFFFVLHPIKTLKSIFSGSGESFKSLSIALAGTLGIGNIVGVASAIMMGGYGAVFWMWVSAFLSMSIKYAEVFLAMRSQRTKNGARYGGAPYYIYDGFLKKSGKKVTLLLASLFAIFCIINSFTTGNLVQVNAVSSLFPISKLLFGIIFALTVFLIVFKGTKSIGAVNSILMPVLCAFYLLLCVVILVSNFEKLPSALSLIVSGAFSPSCAFFGVSGYGISVAIRYGVSRGLLSNEAGAGTSPSAHASSNASAHSQGCLGILEVFIDTIVLCTLTAFVIIVSGVYPTNNAMNFVLNAFYRELGAFGKYGVLVACLLFALATVCTQYFYGKEATRFISRSKWCLYLFNILFFGIIIFGSVLPMNVMWQISDLALAIMTIFNLTCILILHKRIK